MTITNQSQFADVVLNASDISHVNVPESNRLNLEDGVDATAGVSSALHTPQNVVSPSASRHATDIDLGQSKADGASVLISSDGGDTPRSYSGNGAVKRHFTVSLPHLSESINNGIYTLRLVAIRCSAIIGSLLWLLAFVCGGLALSTREWRYNRVDHVGELHAPLLDVTGDSDAKTTEGGIPFRGISLSFVGLHGISRLDAITLDDGANIHVYSPFIDYGILQQYCAFAAEEINKKNATTANGGMLPAYDPLGHNIVDRLKISRPMYAVGNLNPDATRNFWNLYGPAVYDLHCQELPYMKSGAGVLFALVLSTLVLFGVVAILVLDRLGLFYSGPFMLHKSTRQLMVNTTNFIWFVSLLCGIAGIASWEVMAGNSSCISAAGKPVPCMLGTSAYYFIFHLACSLVCGIALNVHE